MPLRMSWLKRSHTKAIGEQRLGRQMQVVPQRCGNRFGIVTEAAEISLFKRHSKIVLEVGRRRINRFENLSQPGFGCGAGTVLGCGNLRSAEKANGLFVDDGSCQPWWAELGEQEPASGFVSTRHESERSQRRKRHEPRPHPQIFRDSLVLPDDSFRGN